jgi:hypothetical protein
LLVRQSYKNEFLIICNNKSKSDTKHYPKIIID